MELARPERIETDLKARKTVSAQALDGFRTQALASDGSYRWAEANLRPLRDDNGEPIGVISSWRRIDKQVAVERELARIAQHDSLTGLLSRGEFLDRFQVMMGHLPRRDERIAVAFCDVDSFKLINVRFGHSAGDDTMHRSI